MEEEEYDFEEIKQIAASSATSVIALKVMLLVQLIMIQLS